VVAKYLARYASREAGLADALGRVLSRPYQHVCVVPAMGESGRLLDGLAPAMRNERALCVLVINARDAAERWVHTRNHELIAALHRRAREVVEIAQGPPIWLCRGVAAGDVAAEGVAAEGVAAEGVDADADEDATIDVLVIDRARSGWRLPAREGVGLARRIGCDMALALHQAGWIGSRWIHTTDADATLPAGYFAAARQAPDTSVALTYPFWHQTEGELGAALSLYEISLRYYVLGLRWAGSPYAFHTIGSTLAVDAGAYAAVRGVPRRMAAEDFYMLAKLAKLGPVTRPAVAPIRLRQRKALRVPFGTAPATARIAEKLARGQLFTLYHPHSFAALGCWLEAMGRFAGDPAMNADACVGQCTGAGAGGLAMPGGLDPELARALHVALEGQDAARMLADARARVNSPAALGRRLDGWFDAFRTLKLIHGMRDAGLATMPWQQALTGAPFIPELAQGASLEQIRKTLFALEVGLEDDGTTPRRSF
jgi:hypothetical protein